MKLNLVRPFKKPNAFKLEDKDTGAFIVAEKTIEPEGIELPAVYVPYEMRNRGIGTQLLKEAIRKITGLYPVYPIYLLAMPMPDCPMTLDGLVEWYQKHGFTPITGDKEAKIMVYDPNKEVQAVLERKA